MRVLLWMPNGHQVPGGHRVQIEQTAAHLRPLGAQASVSFEDLAVRDLAAYDIVHGFGLTVPLIRRCKAAGVRVAFSPIYWSKAYRAGLTRPLNASARLHRLRLGASLFAAALRGRHVEKCDAITQGWHDARTAYEMVDILLPNSRGEAEQMVADLGVTTPMQVVPNAVDELRFPTSAGGGEREGVLYAGRFEPHKNQLGLMHACRDSAFTVTLIGYPHPDHAGYYQHCLAQAKRNLRVAPGVPHEQLGAVLRRAKVHVLPSWYESTGLVSLEAALAGCNIVTTDRGFAREYFQDFAWYCDPAEPASIREAVQAALAAPARPGLREHILAHYTWRHTAAATFKAYRCALATTPGDRLPDESPGPDQPA